MGAAFARYRAVILSNAARLSDEECAALDTYVESGGALAASLETSLEDDDGNRLTRFRLRCMADIEPMGRVNADMNAYFRLAEDNLPGFPPQAELLPAHGPVLCVRPPEGARAMMAFTPPEPNCIPEDAYIRMQTDWPGVVLTDFGEGHVGYLPWGPDRMYHKTRQPAAEALLLGVLELLSPDGRRYLQTDAPASVELTLYRQPGRLLLHLANAGGLWDRHFDEAPPLSNLNFAIEGDFGRVAALALGKDLAMTSGSGRTRFVLPELGPYEVVTMEIS